MRLFYLAAVWCSSYFPFRHLVCLQTITDFLSMYMPIAQVLEESLVWKSDLLGVFLCSMTVIPLLTTTELSGRGSRHTVLISTLNPMTINQIRKPSNVAK